MEYQTTPGGSPEAIVGIGVRADLMNNTVVRILSAALQKSQNNLDYQEVGRILKHIVHIESRNERRKYIAAWMENEGIFFYYRVSQNGCIVPVFTKDLKCEGYENL